MGGLTSAATANFRRRSMWAFRAAWSSAVAATKSLPSALIARAHRDLISSSEDIAVCSLANRRTACHRGNCVELTTKGHVPEARFGGTRNVGDRGRSALQISQGAEYCALSTKSWRWHAQIHFLQRRRDKGHPAGWDCLGTRPVFGTLIRTFGENYESDDHAPCTSWRAGTGVSDCADGGGYGDFAEPAGSE